MSSTPTAAVGPYHTARPSLANFVPPPAGRKKALLVGIVYRGTSHELRGCINDIKCMKYMLTMRFGYRDADIVMLSEDMTSDKRPTKRNIQKWIKWLVEDTRPGDHLFFQYSGHGGSVRDRSGEELDGMNETIMPLDFRRAGQIVDDDLNKMLVHPIQKGVKLHAVIDACHSGTVMDLPFLSKGLNSRGQHIWEDQRVRTYKGTAGGDAICFSGCEDSQTSADTNALSKTANTGALTFAFIKAFEDTVGNGKQISYHSVMQSMNATLKPKGNRKVKPADIAGALLGTMLGVGDLNLRQSASPSFSQTPQISSAVAFDLHQLVDL